MLGCIGESFSLKSFSTHSVCLHFVFMLVRAVAFRLLRFTAVSADVSWLAAPVGLLMLAVSDVLMRQLSNWCTGGELCIIGITAGIIGFGWLSGRGPSSF